MVAALASTSALADSIYLGQPGYGGTGCPQGSVNAVLSPDAQTLSILFDQYMTQVGGSTKKTIDLKTCAVSIPVHVPQGYSVSLIRLDYRGFNSLPHGAQTQLDIEYFFGGSVGPKYKKVFKGPQDQEYTVTNNLIATAVVWSACGADVNLRTNTKLFTRAGANKQDALSTVDSIDATAGIIYKLQWKKC
jgi:hypothetical protein